MKAAGWSQVEAAVMGENANKYFSITRIFGYNSFCGIQMYIFIEGKKF